eukprot:SAG31_NODE_3230_length_4516_cov_3.158252_4_plen_157_part_00
MTLVTCWPRRTQAARAMVPDRVYSDLKWENASHHSFPFDTRGRWGDTTPLPQRYDYLVPKLTKPNRPRPKTPKVQHPKWNPPDHAAGRLFSTVPAMEPSFLTPNQLAAMVQPQRNFDESISRITGLPTRKSWFDFVGAESLRLTRDEQGRTGTAIQ